MLRNTMAVVLGLACLVIAVSEAMAFTMHALPNGSSVGVGIHQPPPGSGNFLDDKFRVSDPFPPQPGVKRVHFHVKVCCPDSCPECTGENKKCTPEFTVTFVVKDAQSVAGPMHTRTHPADKTNCPKCYELPVTQDCGPGYGTPPSQYPQNFQNPPASVSLTVVTSCKCCEGNEGTASSTWERNLTAHVD